MYKQVSALLFGAVFVFGAGTVSPEASRWWSHVQYLASDALQGREAGSAGYEKAVEYVVHDFQQSQVQPAGEHGYLQPVPFRSYRIDEEHSSLSLVQDGKTRPLKLGHDAVYSLRIPPHPPITAPAVFVGYGLKIPELNIDDFAGVDLRGKFAVYMNGAPASVPGPLAAHSRSTMERLKNLHAAGAVGAISFTNPRNIEIPWARSSLARFTPAFSIDDARFTAEPRMTSIAFNSEHVEKLLEGTGHTAADLFRADDNHTPLPVFPLKVDIAASPAFTTGQTKASNIIGVIPGSDRRLKNEYVVLSAHLDHIGIGSPINGDAINNGAMDNASGIAAMLEVAHNLKSAKLKRSILLVAVTGEEKGLLGSKYFVSHPTVKVDSMVADINLDMFLPIIPLHALTVYGIDESTLGAVVRQVASEFGLALEPDREPDKNHFIRSDQYNFILQGIPAISMKFAASPGTPEDAILHNWMKTRYHSRTDDLQQPIDMDGAGKFINVLERLITQIANDPSRPEWNKQSFFTRFAR